MISFLNNFNDPFFFPSSRLLASNSILDNFFDDSLDLFIKDCSRIANDENHENSDSTVEADGENKLVKSNKPSDSLSLFNHDNSLTFKAEWKDDEENHSKKLVLSNLPCNEGSKIDVKIDGNIISVSCEESIKKESKSFTSYSSSRVERCFSIPKGVELSNVSNASPSEGIIEIIFPKVEA